MAGASKKSPSKAPWETLSQLSRPVSANPPLRSGYKTRQQINSRESGITVP